MMDTWASSSVTSGRTSLVWWPRISKDTQERVAACRHYLKKQPSQPREPLLPSALPERPFQRIDVDICEFKGRQYLVSVDYYSRYIDIAYMSQMTSSAVVFKMKNNFAQHGIPETVISDNGTQFTSAEFKKFEANWNFNHVTSSPHYPQANGEAERAVKTAKDILKQEDIFLALLTYRSTPIPALGASPAELAFGRKLRTTLPALPTTFMPRAVNHHAAPARDNAAKLKQKQCFDRRAQPLPELQPGDPVLVKRDGEKEWTLPVEVIQKCAPESYIVQTADGELVCFIA